MIRALLYLTLIVLVSPFLFALVFVYACAMTTRL